MTDPSSRSAKERVLACNRSLNLRSIPAIGYDMDYTLIHYRVDEWERRAFEHIKRRLAAEGWPTDGLEFDRRSVIRGLVVDKEKGNLVKANRFGFVKKAAHGTRAMPFDEQRKEYARTLVDLEEPRWEFLNTLFSVSEACIYRQLVDLLDAGRLPGVMGYPELYEHVRTATDAAHMEGELKAEILADPQRYVVLDEDTPLALLDQKRAGKKLLLITNSEWSYTRPMMTFAFDRYLPEGMVWRDLFDVVVVSARKPTFFQHKSPLYEVVDDEGLLRPTARFAPGLAYAGGSVYQLESYLGLSGDELLYVGDHMFGDVHVTKDVLRWRTALILRELEDEVRAMLAFADEEQTLVERMAAKTELEGRLCQARLAHQRSTEAYGPGSDGDAAAAAAEVAALRAELAELDASVAPHAKAAAERGNGEWGLMMRAGNDKSHLARQVERYADVYTSRVSNFLAATPFVFLRPPSNSLPHDP